MELLEAEGGIEDRDAELLALDDTEDREDCEAELLDDEGQAVPGGQEALDDTEDCEVEGLLKLF